MTAESVLAAMTARAEAATPGPWEWDGLRVPTLIGVGGDPEVYTYATDVLFVEHDGGCACRRSCEMTLDITDADAAFIAAARDDVPRLVATLRAVLALHVECTCCTPPTCNECTSLTYPCATVAAITAALEES